MCSRAQTRMWRICLGPGYCLFTFLCETLPAIGAKRTDTLRTAIRAEGSTAQSRDQAW